MLGFSALALLVAVDCGIEGIVYALLSQGRFDLVVVLSLIGFISLAYPKAGEIKKDCVQDKSKTKVCPEILTHHLK